MPVWIEIAINVATLGFGAMIIAVLWKRRADLLSRPGRAGREAQAGPTSQQPT
jgi:hypothetical protein